MLYDKDIREPLFDFLEQAYGKIRIIEEKTIGKARADILMVTDDGLVGIEIKSDADTYTRLEGQVKYYDKYFDSNIVVVGTHHAGHITEHVPPYWGIITVDEENGAVDFYVLREMQEAPHRKTKVKNQLSLLWREELANIQERNHMYRYKEKSKKFVQTKILEKVPEDLLVKEIREELFERDYRDIESRIEEYRKK